MKNNIANLRHREPVNKEHCTWICKSCGRVNTEYPPFPMTAECSNCGEPESRYCTHDTPLEAL